MLILVQFQVQLQLQGQEPVLVVPYGRYLEAKVRQTKIYQGILRYIKIYLRDNQTHIQIPAEEVTLNMIYFA